MDPAALDLDGPLGRRPAHLSHLLVETGGLGGISTPEWQGGEFRAPPGRRSVGRSHLDTNSFLHMFPLVSLFIAQ